MSRQLRKCYCGSVIFCKYLLNNFNYTDTDLTAHDEVKEEESLTVIVSAGAMEKEGKKEMEEKDKEIDELPKEGEEEAEITDL